MARFAAIRVTVDLLEPRIEVTMSFATGELSFHVLIQDQFDLFSAVVRLIDAHKTDIPFEYTSVQDQCNLFH
ncbi:MAG: hypothetical protein WBE21_10955, partial [Candidatus Acidiferrales bacterium]